MSEPTSATGLALSPRVYRWVDRLTKLGGVAFVAAGLDAGGATVTGVTLGALGAALALSTVFVTRTPGSDGEPAESTEPIERDDGSNRAGIADDHDTETDV